MIRTMEGSVTSCVERNRQGKIILESLQDMRNKKELLDATLACDDAALNVHKLVLSACSSLLRKLISNNPDSRTSICLPGVKAGLLAPLLDFMYAGEVFVAPEDLSDFMELAQELQVKGLTQIAPVDIVTTAESSTVYFDIQKSYQEEDDVHKNENVEPIGAQKDINQNGDDAKRNIYVMEAAILFNATNNVMNAEDENHNSTNVRVEVAELVMDGKQEDERMRSQDIKLKGTEIHVENDSKAPHYEVEDDREHKNQTYIKNEIVKEQFNYTSEDRSEETKISSEEHVLICSKIAKLGVGKDRRHLCKVCDMSGTKDTIYNHIAVEHVNLIAMEQEDKIGKEKQDKAVAEEGKAEKCQAKKDWHEQHLEDKTSTAPKKTAAEPSVEWGDNNDSNIKRLNVMELDDQNGIEHINPNAAELAMEPTNSIDTEHANHKAEEHINSFATEFDNDHAMEHVNPVSMESAVTIATENDNAMEHFNPVGMESAVTIATEKDNGIVTRYEKLNAMEHVTPHVNTNADDQDFNVKGDSEDYCSDKIIVHSVEEKTEQPVLKIAASHKGNEKGNFHNKSNVLSKKRKTVTFSFDEPDEFIYEREEYEDNSHFKKKRIAPSDAEIVADVNDILKLRAGGILSVTKQGFHFQDEPQKIEDLDHIQHKAVCKKIVMLGSNRYKCMECGKKGQKKKMLNHIKKGKFN